MKQKNVIILMAMPDCNNAASNLAIVESHKLEQGVHDSMVASFFPAANVTAKTLPMNDAAIDLTLDCQFFGIKVQFNPSDHTSNQDISVSMALISSLSAPHTDYFVMFSIHLFKGLKIGKSAAKLELRKAYRNEAGTNVPTIALKAYDSNNGMVYSGDLTNMFPIPM